MRPGQSRRHELVGIRSATTSTLTLLKDCTMRRKRCVSVIPCVTWFRLEAARFVTARVFEIREIAAGFAAGCLPAIFLRVVFAVELFLRLAITVKFHARPLVAEWIPQSQAGMTMLLRNPNSDSAFCTG